LPIWKLQTGQICTASSQFNSLFLINWNIIHHIKPVQKQQQQLGQLKFVWTIVVTLFLQFGQVHKTGRVLNSKGFLNIGWLGSTWLFTGIIGWTTATVGWTTVGWTTVGWATETGGWTYGPTGEGKLFTWSFIPVWTIGWVVWGIIGCWLYIFWEDVYESVLVISGLSDWAFGTSG